MSRQNSILKWDGLASSKLSPSRPHTNINGSSFFSGHEAQRPTPVPKSNRREAFLMELCFPGRSSP